MVAANTACFIENRASARRCAGGALGPIGYDGVVKASTNVPVGNCRDIADAALVRAVLTAHEIPVHISGENQAAVIGAGSSAIVQTIWVPQEHVAEARELIEEMRSGGDHALADDEIPEDDTAEREEPETEAGAVVSSVDGPPTAGGADTVSRLRRRDRITLAIAAGMIVSFGTAHMSARAWKRGFVLAAFSLFGWWTLFARDPKLGGAIVVATVAVDIVGAITIILQSDPPLPKAQVRKRS
jgi:hypothetical protein